MYRIGDFARKTGLTPRALRLYEAKGLLVPVRDEDNQYRCYTQADLNRAARLQTLLRLGFSLAEVGVILAALEAENTAENAREALEQLLNRRLEAVSQQARTLRQQQTGLQSALALVRSGEIFSQERLSRLRPLSETTRRDLMHVIESFSLTGPRTENEDGTLIHRQGQNALYVVADGMGGVYASQESMRWLREQVNFSRIDPESYADYFRQLLEQLNRHLYQTQSHLPPDQPRSALCLSLLVLRADRAYLAHVGDTRIYRWSQTELTQLTEDHSVIRRLLAKGEILAKDVPAHPMRHMIYAAIGYEPELKTLFTATELVTPGSVYLLASDGLPRTLSDGEILQQLQAAPLSEAIEQLKTLTERHGDDNVSVIAVPV